MTEESVARQLIDLYVKKGIAQEKTKAQLPVSQQLMIKTLPAVRQAGKTQRDLLIGLAMLPRHRHKIFLMYSPTCRHCHTVKTILEKYAAAAGGTILLLLQDVTPKEWTAYLVAVTKGSVEVPTVIVDDAFLIQGDRGFLEKLTTTIQLAESCPTPTWIEEKWQTRL